MPTVTYDDRSFLIDGSRIWLASGEIHYFRVPAELWKDRLLKAKRCGLNCVSTYIAWNYHEAKEGQWDFTGQRDIVGFVKAAKELGLYVILRPGPYIGAEWDFGGLPPWLTTKTGVSYRSANAAFTHYFDKYFRQVLPRLAELQVPRDGNIILIQNENNYLLTTQPDRLNYLSFITQLFRRSGFEIPILTSNNLTTPLVPEAVECVSTAGNEVQQVKTLRQRQPNAPVVVTEFRTGGADLWGGEHQRNDDRANARRALELLGCGAQYNYYMWHGGTNFDFAGGRTCNSDASYHTTSHDFDAPLAEGGGLTPKYYFTRLVNMLATHMGTCLAGAVMDRPGVSVLDSTTTLNIAGPAGSWAVVSNNGREDIKTATISLTDGPQLDVSLEALGATAVPVNLALTSAIRLDYANVMPLGFFAEKVLIFHGPADWAARVSLNGKEIQAAVPAGDEPTIIEHQGLLVVLINSELAQRTWALAESIILGPQFVGETADDLVDWPRAKQYAVITLPEGKLEHRKAAGEHAAIPAAPALTAWKRLAVCVEPVAANLEWNKLDHPRDVDHLGLHQGYVWYRAEVTQAKASQQRLFLPDCEDRATIYLNGEFLTVWGRGPGATRLPVKAHLRAGVNAITMLVDNLGRFSEDPCLGAAKGLFGHLYDAEPLSLDKAKLKPYTEFSRRMVPRHLTHLIPELEAGPIWSAEIPLSLTSVRPVHLSFAGLGHHVAVICNARAAKFFPCNPGAQNFGDVTLGPELKKGRNSLQVLLWGKVEARELAQLHVHLLNENLTEAANWSYRPWSVPQPGGLIVGKEQPAWYVSQFKYQATGAAMFLHIIGAKKGQAFLNGRNLGRFWTVGPQQHYYLPACWLKEQNELMIFEERGLIPAHSTLEFRPQGPYRS